MADLVRLKVGDWSTNLDADLLYVDGDTSARAALAFTRANKAAIVAALGPGWVIQLVATTKPTGNRARSHSTPGRSEIYLKRGS
jgi:hypothetical protein